MAALFAALFALGVAPAPALAQVPPPVLTVTKTPDNLTISRGGIATFTIVVSNAGQADAFDGHIEDPLPGTLVIDWEIVDAETDLAAGCDIEGTPPPDPGFESDPQVLRCDINTLLPGESVQVVVTGQTPDACLVLNNIATLTWTDGPAGGITDGGMIASTGCDGRMTGGGSIIGEFVAAGTRGNSKTSTRVTHGFELRCNASDPRQNLEINWPGDNRQNNFHLTSLTDAVCSDDPNIDPKPPAAGFDTFAGTGVGTCNGQAADIVFVFTDAGEPGRKDTAEYHISGACTLDAAGNISKGNQQAHDN